MNQKGFVVRPIVVAKAHKPAVFYRRKLTSTPIAVLHTPYSFGEHRLRQEVQWEPLCRGVADPVSLKKVFVRCVENRRWTYGGVTCFTF